MSDQRPTAEDYETARRALRESGVVSVTQTDWHHRRIVDLVWPIAFAAGWRAHEESMSPPVPTTKETP